jgi:hypothetical protein
MEVGSDLIVSPEACHKTSSLPVEEIMVVSLINTLGYCCLRRCLLTQKTMTAMMTIESRPSATHGMMYGSDECAVRMGVGVEG